MRGNTAQPNNNLRRHDEKCTGLAHESTHRRTALDCRERFLLGRNSEIRLREPGNRPLSPLPLPAVPPKGGMWAVLHEVRSEYVQLLTAVFLMINGPGRWSLDALLERRAQGTRSQLVAASRRKESANASAMV